VTSATATTTADEAAVDYVPAPAVGVELTTDVVAAPRTRKLHARTEWALARFAIDFAMLGMGVSVAETGWRAAGFAPSPLGWVIAFPLVALVLLYARGAYTARLQPQLLDEVRKAVGATAIAAMAVTTTRVVISDATIPSAQAVRPWIFATICLVAGRAVLTLADHRARRRGETLRPTVILGAGRVGQVVARRLLEHPEIGLKPVGFLDKEPLGALDGVPTLGASWDLERVVAEHGVENVIVTFSTAPHEVLLRLAKRCEELGVEISFVPRLFERVPERLTVDHLGGIPLLTPRSADPSGWQFAVKYAADRLAAAALLVLFSPVMLVAMAAVLVTTGRPIFFRQARVGLDGREFGMLKFRTMRGCPEEGGEADADWAARETGGEDLAPPESGCEDRRTPLGRILRRTSLDELPQLWNVLTGDMSLVGPRPERAHYVRRFEQSVYRYAERHRVKSGMTGWAQVNGLRGKTSLADRIEWDNYYIENWSLWLDLKILLRTALAVVRS
jgi:exopolysaccharide biosynthesis polyprenyl glycosylphosphotransferase